MGDSRNNPKFSIAHHCDSKALPVQLLFLTKTFVQCIHAVYTICPLVTESLSRMPDEPLQYHRAYIQITSILK